MGSIVYINKNPKTWVAIDEGYTLTGPYNYAPILKIRYGSFDDDPDGLVEMEMHMRKSIYENLMSGKYKVSREHTRELRVLDENNQIIGGISSCAFGCSILSEGSFFAGYGQ